MNAMTEFPAAISSEVAENMEVIGRLSGGIAHDFNNLLTGILLYCDLLLAGLENGGEKEDIRFGLRHETGQRDGLDRKQLRRHVEEIRLASEQGAAMTQQLLSIARKRVVQPAPVLINEIVASTINLLRRLIGEQIELVVTLDPSLDPRLDSALDKSLDPSTAPSVGSVLADAAQIRQVLLNLVLNARDAVSLGADSAGAVAGGAQGRIDVCTRATHFPRAGSLLDEVAEVSRRAVSLTVQDNGCGMDATTRARIFELFFTTKQEGAGTGLGMTTVQRIVSESGGVVEVESEISRGSCIRVFFPLVEAFP